MLSATTARLAATRFIVPSLVADRFDAGIGADPDRDVESPPVHRSLWRRWKPRVIASVGIGGIMKGVTKILLAAGLVVVVAAALVWSARAEDPAQRKAAMIKLGLSHKTAADLYQALAKQANGGKR